MEIDLTLLESGSVNELDITNKYSLPKQYYYNTGIVSLDDIEVEGKIYRSVAEDDLDELQLYIDCKISGKMILEDSISLEPVEYPFETEYDDILEENCKKSKNTLDIFQFLWENIVLEIPLQFTKVKDLSKFHGDGWRLISEDDLKTSTNPFGDLLKDLNTEE